MAATVGGDHQSLPATLLLGSLTLGLGHSLAEEIKRQARRGSASWTRTDTTNAVLLGLWAELALVMTILLLDTTPARAVGLGLAAAYAAACGYFVTERRRAIASQPAAVPSEPPETATEHLPTAVEVGMVAPSDNLDGTVPQRRHPAHVGHAPTAGDFYADTAH